MKKKIANYLKRKYGEGHIDYSYPFDWGNPFRWIYDDETYLRAGMRFITILGVTLLVKD